MNEKYPHIFLRDPHDSMDFKTPSRGGGKRNFPGRNRNSHALRLMRQMETIRREAEQKLTLMPEVPSTKRGVYVEFEGEPGFELATKSLENRRAGIRLLNVQTSGDKAEQQTTRATVFIPENKLEYFLGKIGKYAHEETKKGKPKNDLLIRSITEIKSVETLDSFWSDGPDLMPSGDAPVWCEIWIRETGEDSEQRFKDTAENLSIEVSSHSLRFPERIVLLGKATREQLDDLIQHNPYLAEVRKAKETARFFLELENKEQAEWVDDLKARLNINADPDVAVCILDTGANNGHTILSPVLSNQDCHTVDPAWGTNDHAGHGTLMCGIAAFGDLSEHLRHNGMVKIDHCLESAKILPPAGKNKPELYGDITIQGISRAEIQAPQRSRIGCMSVTSEDDRDRGRPSSWSAAIDKLTSGDVDGGNRKRLLILSAGNVDESDWQNYPDSNFTHSVHDPGQSWNALTVGAYTEKSRLTDPDLQDSTPLAQPNELSPFSSTSLVWDSKWPVKPEIVMEGGNLAKDPGGFISQHDDLSMLSTNYQPQKRQFDLINATSAAAGQAAHMAAQIQARYPDAWPETVRGLMVHSAEWPDALKKQIMGNKQQYQKSDYKRLLRCCGYGVPNLGRALACASNSLTIVSESEIQPYTKKETGSAYSTKEMNFHKLPWPNESLLSLGSADVTLRITLSYFIEPGPGEVGWKDRYRYASHALRFDLKTSGESEENFKKRINAAAREGDEKPEKGSGSGRWLIGKNNRDVGSVHSDIWTGNAAEMATCDSIGVYPTIGWWRERAWLDRWGSKARYSLIVSLHTPDESVDIYTPVANKVGITVSGG